MASQVNTGRPIALLRKPIPDEAYMRWIRKQDCLTCKPGDKFYGYYPIDAAHTRQQGQGGKGTKTDDSTCIPLCWACHRTGYKPDAYHEYGSEAKWAEHHDLKLDEIKAELRERYVRQA